MKMRSTRVSKTISRQVMALTTSVILLIAGLILAFPFLYVIFILGHSFHYVTAGVFLMILGLLLGGPMFIIGLIGVTTSSNKTSAHNSSMSDIDTARIRHAVETGVKENMYERQKNK